MPGEGHTPMLANMGVPPRSTVTLPSLAPPAPGPDARGVPVGPGGGSLCSHALCITYVNLPEAVCAWLRLGTASPLLNAPLGLARALVAIARLAARGEAADTAAAVAEIEGLGPTRDGDLVQELLTRLAAIPWPEWVPPVAFARAFAPDIAVGALDLPPPPPYGVTCPLLAARLASAIRGPIFLRDAAPTLTHLLNLYGRPNPSGSWDIWLPIRPGTVRPVMST